jgi:predicted ABC-type ATPase
MSRKCVIVIATALKVSTKSQFFLSVHEIFAVENTLSVAAIVPRMAKGNSKMSVKEMHVLCAPSSNWDQFSAV